MEGMEAYPRAAVERAMKVQEVMLRAMARKITWYQAAEILGITDRHLRRWRERYEQFGFEGVLDRRRCRENPRPCGGDFLRRCALTAICSRIVHGCIVPSFKANFPASHKPSGSLDVARPISPIRVVPPHRQSCKAH